MEQNKIRTYFLYAIGEIALVMIGILLALQVNNWNEDRKERYLESKLLQQIQTDLISNQKDVTELIDRLVISTNSADSLLKSFRTQKEVEGFVFHASLIHRRFFFNPSSSGYAQLTTSAANLIQNDELRNRILDIYEVEFNTISKRQELLSDHMDRNLFPLSRSRFSLNKQISFKMSEFDENSMDFYSPVNFRELSRDTEYANTVVVQKRLYSIQLNQLNKTLSQLEQTLKLLEQEINSKKI